MKGKGGKLRLVFVIVFALGGGYYVMNRQTAEAPTKEFTAALAPIAKWGWWGS